MYSTVRKKCNVKEKKHFILVSCFWFSDTFPPPNKMHTDTQTSLRPHSSRQFLPHYYRSFTAQLPSPQFQYKMQYFWNTAKLPRVYRWVTAFSCFLPRFEHLLTPSITVHTQAHTFMHTTHTRTHTRTHTHTLLHP